MKKKFMCMLMAAAMTLSMAACGSKGDDANTDDNAGGASDGVQTFTVGTSGPLTGDNAIYGMAVKQGVELAVNEINASDSKIKFEFLSQDDEGDGEKAVNAYNTMMDNGMQVLVGPTTTGASIAVADVCYNDRTFMLTPSASSTDVTAGKDNVFQVCFTDPNQGVNAAKFLAEKYPDEKIAVFYRNDDAYSQGIAAAFTAQAAESKLQIVADNLTFTEDTQTDFKVQLTKAMDAGATMLFAPIYYTPASVLLTQASEMAYGVKVFGCDGMDGILGVENFDTALAEGVMLLTPFSADDEKNADFVKAYQDAYGEVPDQFAADAYDGVHALAEALKAAGVAADAPAEEACDAIAEAMLDVHIEGLTGKLSWNEQGQVQKEPAAYVIKDGKYVAA